MVGAIGAITFVLVPAIAPVFETAGRPPPAIVGILLDVREFLTGPFFWSWL